MKIQSLKISNVFSYDYRENIDEAEMMILNQWINILIWPNGSGKSSIIEILNQIFKKIFFMHPNINKNHIWKAEQKQTITTQVYPNLSLTQNWSHKDKNMQIKIWIGFSLEDKENVRLIYENKDTINNWFSQYVSFNNHWSPIDHTISWWWGINTIDDLGILDEINALSIEILLTIDPLGKLISINYNGLPDNIKEPILWYLYRFTIIKEVLNLWEVWLHFNDTFWFISCYRHYGDIQKQFSTQWHERSKVNEEKNKMIGEQTRLFTNQWEPIVFNIVKRKLAYEYKKYHNEWWQEFASTKILENELFSSLQENLNLIWLSLWLAQNDTADANNYAINFLNAEWVEVNAIDLSAWQKAIIHLLFSVYWMSLKNWCVVIDEPELHLHPQFEYELTNIIEKISNQFNLQFIISTHSGRFLNKNTIKNAIRLSKDSWFTKIYQPNTTQLLAEEDLLRFLENRRLNDIFFYKKIVLVEWQSDQYFFTAFANLYLLEKSNDILFLQMNSKNEYPKWHKLLIEFWINAYFIGDFDNIKQFQIWNSINLEDIKSLISTNLIAQVSQSILKDDVLKQSSLDGETFFNTITHIIETQSLEIDKLTSIREKLVHKRIKYQDILDYLKEHNSAELDQIYSQIEALYNRRVFILKNWDLENYLGIWKSFINVINISNNIEERFNTSNDTFKLAELKIIFDKIAE